MKTRKRKNSRKRKTLKGGIPIKTTPAKLRLKETMIRDAPYAPVKSKKDYSADFQNLIDGLGSPEVLKEFAYYSGRDKLNVIVPAAVPDRRSTRSVPVPSDFTGIAYDGAHWKGYENGVMMYDSYKMGIQNPGTNNYCQSYATYLWAKKGAIYPFKASEYSSNVMSMSKIWLDFFNKQREVPENWKYIKESFEMEGGTKKYDISDAIILLGKLSTDSVLANEFSNSKEDSAN